MSVLLPAYPALFRSGYGNIVLKPDLGNTDAEALRYLKLRNVLVSSTAIPGARGNTIRCDGQRKWDRLELTVARGEKVSQGPLEPLFQVRILARQLRFA